MVQNVYGDSVDYIDVYEREWKGISVDRIRVDVSFGDYDVYRFVKEQFLEEDMTKKFSRIAHYFWQRKKLMFENNHLGQHRINRLMTLYSHYRWLASCSLLIFVNLACCGAIALKNKMYYML